MRKVLFFILLLLAVIPCSWAKEEKKNTLEDNGYPYFIAIAVFPQNKGILEVILVPQFNKSKSRNEFYLTPQFFYGVTDSWQIYSTAQIYKIYRTLQNNLMEGDSMDSLTSMNFDRETSGYADTDIGTQYSWMYIDKSNFSTSILFNLHIPTGDINRNLTDGLLRYEPNVMLARDFPHKKWHTQIFSQIGFSFVQRAKRHANPEEDEPSAHSFVLNSGISARSEKLNYSLELDWRVNTWNNNGTENTLYCTPGVYIQIKENAALGLGVPIGLTHSADRYEIIANLLIDIDTIFVKKNERTKEKENVKEKKIGRVPTLRPATTL